MRQRALIIIVGLSAVIGCGSSGDDLGDASSAPDAAATADAALIDAAIADARVLDAGPLGGTSAASLQIQAVIRSVDGTVDLFVDDVLVTYVKPSGTGDVAGYVVQAEQIGPALFVIATAITPAVTPSVGDRVSFHVTEKRRSFGAARAIEIDNFTTSATGVDVEPLRQDVSTNTLLITDVERYASELIHIEATIAGPWEPAATGHQRAPLTTVGITTTAPVGAGGLWLRLPTPPFDVTGAVVGCAVSLDGILWRFSADPQVTTYLAAELTVTCL